MANNPHCSITVKHNILIVHVGLKLLQKAFENIMISFSTDIEWLVTISTEAVIEHYSSYRKKTVLSF